MEHFWDAFYSPPKSMPFNYNTNNKYLATIKLIVKVFFQKWLNRSLLLRDLLNKNTKLLWGNRNNYKRQNKIIKEWSKKRKPKKLLERKKKMKKLNKLLLKLQKIHLKLKCLQLQMMQPPLLIWVIWKQIFRLIFKHNYRLAHPNLTFLLSLDRRISLLQ